MLKRGGGGRASISDGSSRRENRLRRRKGARGGGEIRTKGRPPYIGTLLLACQLSEMVECLNSLSLFLFFSVISSAIVLSQFNFVANRPRQRGKRRWEKREKSLRSRIFIGDEARNRSKMIPSLPRGCYNIFRQHNTVRCSENPMSN